MTMARPFDPHAFKRAAREQWDRAADGWNDSSAKIRAWLCDATEAMLDMAAIKKGSRVLDVAAGAGDQTLDIAARVGPGGHVLAVDLSERILEFAKRNAEHAGHRNVEIRVADGEHLPDGDATFDAAVCRLGLMLFPAPLQALREMFRVLKPGGGICTMVFSTPEANPCVAALMSTALEHAGLRPGDPYRPSGLLSLGKPGLIDDLFARAGFREVATTKVSAPFKLASPRDYLDFVRSSASPILQILGKLDNAAKEAAWADIERRLERFKTTAGWEGPNELLLTAGRR